MKLFCLTSMNFKLNIYSLVIRQIKIYIVFNKQNQQIFRTFFKGQSINQVFLRLNFYKKKKKIKACHSDFPFFVIVYP